MATTRLARKPIASSDTSTAAAAVATKLKRASQRWATVALPGVSAQWSPSPITTHSSDCQHCL